MIREIIHIDEEKCNGCGLCIPNCPEGALQVIDGKARLLSDLFCDGLGACIGYCPEGAITVEKREAEPYDERKVMQNIVRQGEATIAAHLRHLEEHGETELADEARAFLEEQGMAVPAATEDHKASAESDARPVEISFGCPGSRFRALRSAETANKTGPEDEADSLRDAPVVRSELTQWPVQLHLIPAGAPWLKDRDFVLCADCVGYAVGDFHNRYLKGKALAIACPKLDSGLDVYLQKLTAIIENTGVRSIEVLMMQVPCCGGLLKLVQQAAAEANAAAKKRIPIRYRVISIEGEVLESVDLQ